MRKQSDRGASLVLVLVVVAVLVSLIGGTTALVSARTRLLEDRTQRIRLQTLAEQGLAQVVRVWIDPDTNEWDSLDERWADYREYAKVPEVSHCSAFRSGDVFELQIEDEYSRIGTTNRLLRCEEDLLVSEVEKNELDIFSSNLRPFFSWTTAYTDGSINLNTVSKEAFYLLCARVEGLQPATDSETGYPTASSKAAESLWNRLESIRFRGGVFHRATAEEALRVFGEYPTGVPPSTAELTLLGQLQPMFRSQGGIFRLSARVSRGRTRIGLQLVYERSTHRILRWAEM